MKKWQVQHKTENHGLALFVSYITKMAILGTRNIESCLVTIQLNYVKKDRCEAFQEVQCHTRHNTHNDEGKRQDKQIYANARPFKTDTAHTRDRTDHKMAGYAHAHTRYLDFTGPVNMQGIS